VANLIPLSIVNVMGIALALVLHRQIGMEPLDGVSSDDDSDARGGRDAGVAAQRRIKSTPSWAKEA